MSVHDISRRTRSFSGPNDVESMAGVTVPNAGWTSSALISTKVAECLRAISLHGSVPETFVECVRLTRPVFSENDARLLLWGDNNRGFKGLIELCGKSATNRSKLRADAENLGSRPLSNKTRNRLRHKHISFLAELVGLVDSQHVHPIIQYHGLSSSQMSQPSTLPTASSNSPFSLRSHLGTPFHDMPCITRIFLDSPLRLLQSMHLQDFLQPESVKRYASICHRVCQLIFLVCYKRPNKQGINPRQLLHMSDYSLEYYEKWLESWVSRNASTVTAYSERGLKNMEPLSIDEIDGWSNLPPEPVFFSGIGGGEADDINRMLGILPDGEPISGNLDYESAIRKAFSLAEELGKRQGHMLGYNAIQDRMKEGKGEVDKEKLFSEVEEPKPISYTNGEASGINSEPHLRELLQKHFFQFVEGQRFCNSVLEFLSSSSMLDSKHNHNAANKAAGAADFMKQSSTRSGTSLHTNETTNSDEVQEPLSVKPVPPIFASLDQRVSELITCTDGLLNPAVKSQDLIDRQRYSLGLLERLGDVLSAPSLIQKYLAHPQATLDSGYRIQHQQSIPNFAELVHIFDNVAYKLGEMMNDGDFGASYIASEAEHGESEGTLNIRLAEQLIIKPMDAAFMSCYESMMTYATCDQCDAESREFVVRQYSQIYNAWSGTRTFGHKDTNYTAEGFVNTQRMSANERDMDWTLNAGKFVHDIVDRLGNRSAARLEELFRGIRDMRGVLFSRHTRTLRFFETNLCSKLHVCCKAIDLELEHFIELQQSEVMKQCADNNEHAVQKGDSHAGNRSILVQKQTRDSPNVSIPRSETSKISSAFVVQVSSWLYKIDQVISNHIISDVIDGWSSALPPSSQRAFLSIILDTFWPQRTEEGPVVQKKSSYDKCRAEEAMHHASCRLISMSVQNTHERLTDWLKATCLGMDMPSYSSTAALVKDTVEDISLVGDRLSRKAFKENAQTALETMVLDAITTTGHFLANAKEKETSDEKSDNKRLANIFNVDGVPRSLHTVPPLLEKSSISKSLSAFCYLKIWKSFADFVVPEFVDAISKASEKQFAHERKPRLSQGLLNNSGSYSSSVEYVQRLQAKVKLAIGSSFRLILTQCREEFEAKISAVLGHSDEEEGFEENLSSSSPRSDFYNTLVLIVQCKTLLIELGFYSAIDTFVRPVLVHMVPLARGYNEAFLLRKAMQYAGVEPEECAALNGVLYEANKSESANEIVAHAEMLLLALIS